VDGRAVKWGTAVTVTTMLGSSANPATSLTCGAGEGAGGCAAGLGVGGSVVASRVRRAHRSMVRWTSRLSGWGANSAEVDLIMDGQAVIGRSGARATDLTP